MKFGALMALGAGGGGNWVRPGLAKADTRPPLGGAASREAAQGIRKSGKPRILMIISDTGGGHRASAGAVKGAIEQLFGISKFDITIVDLWKKHTPWPHNQFPDTYSFLVQYPILWRLTYLLTAPKAVHVPQLRLVKAMVGRQVGKAFDEYDPDLVVSFHPLLNHIPIQVLESRARRGARKPPFATVVSDYTTCHPTW